MCAVKRFEGDGLYTAAVSRDEKEHLIDDPNQVNVYYSTKVIHLST